MPARLREIAQALSTFGIELRKPSSGSHYKLVQLATGRSYPIPAHNGERTEIGDHYLRGACRAFGIEYADVRRIIG